ncbi:ABC transporter ATP-binding protein [Sporolactobacillus shoreicorticis]|uniref:ABC transporter ATP-binding protein n=1 Tax=Sporolactobacillus shoreicorticis TaxID=1923877 RepID=A0ABW5S0S4_9BACL|nr:ABC transporter ATP-binding protein [Sporolactobacillus shoreicorticis]MCO7127259.1 ABC transporter ATP-binding protein [Sporolactobacillus shoreicorticis]
MVLLKINRLNKIYNGKVNVRAISNLDMEVEKGEFLGIMGPSGSGKTSLLNMIATIDPPTSGSIRLNGKDPYALNFDQLAAFRRQKLGFIFQSFNLLDTLTVKENIFLPLTLDGAPLSEMDMKLERIAERLGIKHILEKRTYEISGGEAQRTAIARAIIHNPELFLADEPTGNLDSKNSAEVMQLLEQLNSEEEATILLVTHDPQAASFCSRVVFIKDGSLYNEIYRGDSRTDFYQRIMDTLKLLGGGPR